MTSTGSDWPSLSEWWRDEAAQEVAVTAPKMEEYGSRDLEEMGRVMHDLRSDPNPIDARRAAELGIYFYVLGKMARWTNAVRNAVDVSDDTLHDIAVYIKMAQHLRYCDESGD